MVPLDGQGGNPGFFERSERRGGLPEDRRRNLRRVEEIAGDQEDVGLPFEGARDDLIECRGEVRFGEASVETPPAQMKIELGRAFPDLSVTLFFSTWVIGSIVWI